MPIPINSAFSLKQLNLEYPIPRRYQIKVTKDYGDIMAVPTTFIITSREYCPKRSKEPQQIGIFKDN